jgi:hypothetical protein
MHFCTATIALAGDGRNTIDRNTFSPVSWPEIEVIRIVHGEEAILEASPFVAVEQSPRAERTRLAYIYGDVAVQQVWGGRSVPSEMSAPQAKLAAGVRWFNPLTHETELTGADGGSSTKAPPLPVTPMAKAEVVGDMTRPAPVPEPAESEMYEDDGDVVAIAEPDTPTRRRK